ncbi:hypothetical protein V5799_015325 [Amblyomma americanum]|uniref:Amino acid transporter n=1 Tax=Amblyomma americanum TaxID=6943 RepID=A0AAQ4E0G8_AMBAM
MAAPGSNTTSQLPSPFAEFDEAITEPCREVRSSGVVFYESVFGIAMLVSVVIGASVGITLRFLFKERWSPRHVMYLAFPGELLSLMLRETALPLSASSVIAAAGSMERPLARRVARHAISYVLLVKAASQGCAVLATFTVQPGRAVEPGDVQRLLEAVPPQARLVERSNGTADAFSDMASICPPVQLMASHLGLYLFTVVLALGTHALLVLPLTAMAGTRRSFRALICHGALPLLLSLSMGSGRDTVPATIVALEERLHLDPRIEHVDVYAVRLLVPALAVLAVNGTSICVTVSALFFGHMKTDNIEPLTVLYVCLLSELCSMATPTGGGPGYLRLRLIQETVGMPTEYVGILFVTDWIVCVSSTARSSLWSQAAAISAAQNAYSVP